MQMVLKEEYHKKVTRTTFPAISGTQRTVGLWDDTYFYVTGGRGHVILHRLRQRLQLSGGRGHLPHRLWPSLCGGLPSQPRSTQHLPGCLERFF